MRYFKVQQKIVNPNFDTHNFKERIFLKILLLLTLHSVSKKWKNSAIKIVVTQLPQRQKPTFKKIVHSAAWFLQNILNKQ